MVIPISAPLNFAPTDWGWSSIRTLHVAPSTETQPNGKLVSVEPEPVRTVSTTVLFASKSAAHTSGQRMPGGVLVITSPWLPEVTTESVSLEKSARSSGRRRG